MKCDVTLELSSFLHKKVYLPHKKSVKMAYKGGDPFEDLDFLNDIGYVIKNGFLVTEEWLAKLK